MRILLLSQFYPPIVGGEERHVQNLASALLRLGHHVSVATLWYPGCQSCELDGKIRVYRIRGTLQRFAGVFAESERRHAPPFPDPELVLGLRKVMARERPDIVHAHNWLLASAIPLKRWSGARMVMTLHDYSLICPKKNFIHNGEICDGPRLTKCLACARTHYGSIKAAVTVLGNSALRIFARRTVDRFIAVSHAVARYTGLAESGAAFDVIPNFVPDDVGHPNSVIDVCLSALPSEPFILFVGDLMHLKGVDVLVQAYAKLDRPPPLVLIGRKCADTPKELPPHVHMFSLWPHSAIMHAWRRCLFGVLPSVGPEACATVVMEAMASGKPVVASDIGGMPDLIESGKTGLLIRPGDVDELAAALQSLLDHPELITMMGASSLAHVEQLKASAVVARIENLYREVLRDRAPDGRDRGHECLEAAGKQPCRS